MDYINLANFVGQTPVMVPAGTTIQSLIDAEQTSQNLVSIVDGAVSPVFNTVTASQYVATANGTGDNYKIGDDAYIGDINVSNTIGIKGVQDSTQGYVKFGTSGPIVGFASTAALPIKGVAVTGSLIQKGANLYFYNGQAGNGGWATVI